MRKICKIKFQQVNETKLNRYQLGKLKKKKDAMVSPKKPPNGWTAFPNEKLKEVS